jgi:DNA gyrase subunit A
MAGRSTQGVIVLNTAEDEKVVSLERLSEEEGDNGDE